ncbi:pilus assembly protein PapC [Pseudomonas daroniae]|nr:pilus assembly protein PapC [Pseudomonas daroniae]
MRSILLPLGSSVITLLPAKAIAATSVPTAELSTLTQAQGLPADFAEHFFDVPLAVRVDLDGRPLGEAMVMLGRDDSVRLIEFTDTTDSPFSPAERQPWIELLGDGWPLGACHSSCPSELMALHYSLATSQLSILTAKAEADPQRARYYQLPEGGSQGLMLYNQLNLTGGQQQETAGRYALEAQGSLGNWTTVAGAQVHRSATGNGEEPLRYYAQNLYAERQDAGNFWRLGYFTPDAHGVMRQPQTLGSSPQTTLGLMYGSSDSLAVDSSSPSATPIYVTPNRPGVVELYRNGVLLNSQPVQPGLQAIDTRNLPGGIYEVEVRLVEDGQVTSSEAAFIYKPNNWHDPDQPWRYNLYLGRQSNLLSNWEARDNDALTAGAIVNYLLHPRAVLGLSTQRVDETTQFGTSLDWSVLDNLSLYGNLYHSRNQGHGFDLQGIYSYASGSLVVSHSRTAMDRGDSSRTARSASGEVQQSALSMQHRVTYKSSATLRLAHSSGASQGTGVDLGWLYNGTLLSSDANWRLSVFDRPGTLSSGNERNRGFDVTLSLALGAPGKRLTGSFGSRASRDGGRDQNAAVTYQQSFADGALRSVSGTVTADSYGTGLSGSAYYQGDLASGDLYLQRSSYDDALSGGLNLTSTVALGAGTLAASGDSQLYAAGMIVDVESDNDAIALRADDLNGHSTVLKPGRNVIPLTAYKSGTVQFDFAGRDAPAAVIQPQAVSYHLNQGGVSYQKIRVMNTVTVMGRLLDAQGQPLKGALISNHASRSVSEADGFFAVEMSESSPTLNVQWQGNALCQIRLEKGDYRREQDSLLVGNLVCAGSDLAARKPALLNSDS